jgi:hypothetical protein
MHSSTKYNTQCTVLHNSTTVGLQRESKADDIKYKNKKRVICRREGNIMALPKELCIDGNQLT